MSDKPKEKKTNLRRDTQERIRPGDFGLSQHTFQTFNATIPTHRNTEALLIEPEYWAHVAGKMKVGDEIRALAEDFSFRAELIVTFVQGTVVRLKLLDLLQLEDVETEVTNDDYEIRQRGMRKWCIVKKTTGEVIQENIPTKAEAAVALEQFVKVLAA